MNDRGPGKEPIAIVGVGCRFPGANGPEAFWDLLLQGGDAITEVPPERFDVDALFDSQGAPGKLATRYGGFLRDVDRFDASFFGISPREAQQTDPQQRLLLEVVWEALEDAGLVREELAGSPTGVFIGMLTNDYEDLHFYRPEGIDIYATVGGYRCAAAGRISYFLDLEGPSLAVDTACSSSLVAVHLACQSLWSGESTLAIAGGSNLLLQPQPSLGFSRAGMLAADGRCKFGDARADGFIRSEGVAAVILEPWSRAVAARDPVYAVILGSAVNNDGRGSGFMMTPAVRGQEAVLRRAYRSAGVAPGQVQYVEAHGTGTRTGDPVELAALGAVLADGRPADRPCAIGSVKSNIGHTEAAAGLAGLIKVALSLRHCRIAPSLHHCEPNPEIPWQELPFMVPREPAPWPADAAPRLAGVSSFGISGTNAHVVMAEAPRADEATEETPGEQAASEAQLYALSAHNPQALEAAVRAHHAFLSSEGAEACLEDLCYTAGARRAHHGYRTAFVVSSRSELVERLEAAVHGAPGPAGPGDVPAPGRRPKIVFVFPGQGSQWRGMGRSLLRREAVFRDALERCAEAMRPHVSWSLLEELTSDASDRVLEDVDVIQPALFALQVALAALWRSWGVEPDAVVGQSMGEVAAAHVAGALSVEDAARIICRRSQLAKTVSGNGAMAVVELSIEEAESVLRGYEEKVSVAVSNSPVSSVLAGDPAALEEILRKLAEREVFCRLVKVDYASHSPQMDPLRDDLLRLLEGVEPRTAAVSIHSTVTGTRVDGGELGAEYWVDNLRRTVLFSASVDRLLNDGHDAFLEISPHPVVLSSIQQCLDSSGRRAAVLPSLRREEDERTVMLRSLAALYARGGSVDWRELHSGGRRCVRLPPYPWQRERHWLEISGPAAGLAEYLPKSSWESPQNWLYEVEWRQAELGDERPTAPGTWLVLADEDGVGRRLAALLEASGQEPVLVFPGEAVGFVPLLDDLRHRNVPVRGVVHLGSLGAAVASELTLDGLEAAGDLGCRSALNLVHALSGAGIAEPPPLWLVTRGAVSAGAESRLPGLAQSPLWGLGEIVALEHPELHATRVDLEPEAGAGGAEELFEILRRESGEGQWAVRGGQLRVPRLVRRRLAGGKEVSFGDAASYLITGGLGELGLLVAEWLVKRGARHLALVGRSAARPEARRRLRRLERAGARVLVARADVTSTGDVGRLLDRIGRELPPLSGVFHLAGVGAVVRALSEQTWQDFTEVMAAKVAGAWNLHLHTRDVPLDLFVLFSSAAGLLGFPGQSSYAAANAFLDALASFRRARGLAAVSIDWGAWSVGVAERVQTGRAWRERVMGAIDPAVGIRLLERVLAGDCTRLGAVPVRWPEFLERFPAGTEPPFFAEMVREIRGDERSAPAADGQLELLRQLKKSSAGNRRELLASYLHLQLSRLLGVAPSFRPPPSQLLTELGFDSLMGVQLRNAIAQDLEVNVPTRRLLDNASVESLTELLYERSLSASEASLPTSAMVLEDNLEEFIL